ncbi:hypothetical protein ANCDUO_00614 [Ancylostoma duodenale]|uniref:Uncharacterized protein n=1 Tax=Ancylostoma duodenale TaxID=51022 RepID=A0A0C2HHD8_9BILA|nr:hypothetical protein ANCDUO_00614 [Ancylostoma duodenale]
MIYVLTFEEIFTFRGYWKIFETKAGYRRKIPYLPKSGREWEEQRNSLAITEQFVSGKLERCERGKFLGKKENL